MNIYILIPCVGGNTVLEFVAIIEVTDDLVSKKVKREKIELTSMHVEMAD